MSLQTLIEADIINPDLRITSLKKNTLLYLGYESRDKYYDSFLRRLEFIPQLFLDSSARNRLTHVKNGLAILKSLEEKGFFDSNRLNKNILAQLKKSFLLHDIGHPQYGHAGERAINEFLNEYDLFFHNSNFSIELQSRQSKNDNDFVNMIGNNIFKLESVEIDDQSKIIIDKLVDFIDDIENAVGDLADLIKVLHHSGSKILHSKYFKMRDDYVVDNAVFLVHKYIKSSSQFESFLFDENHELKNVIREIRLYVRQVVKCEKALAATDLIWFEKTSDDIHTVFNLLSGIYNTYSQKEIAEVTAKIVALKAL